MYLWERHRDMQGKTLKRYVSTKFQVLVRVLRFHHYSLVSMSQRVMSAFIYDKKTLKKGTFFPTHTYLLLLTRDSYETKINLSVLTERKI